MLERFEGERLLHDIDVPRDADGAVRARGHAADDDEFDTAAGERLQQPLEVGHRNAFFPDSRTVSTNRVSSTSRRRRWSGVIFSAARSSDRSTSFLYSSMISSIDDRGEDRPSGGVATCQL
jgi:hypothetical protein